MNECCRAGGDGVTEHLMESSFKEWNEVECDVSISVRGIKVKLTTTLGRGTRI